MRNPANAEDTGLQDQCLAFLTAGPPMLPYSYNSNYQIMQTKDAFVVHAEMIHDARIIRLDGRPHAPPEIRLWMGDSVGHWAGDTLVVDTTNFTDKVLYRGAAENLHLVERFTRVGPGEIDYRVTIDDPTTFSKPWTLAIPYVNTGEDMFEYACHEGNNSMRNILSGARAADR